MATQTIYESERLSFYKIFSERNYKVIIPKIQREYAQGRKSSIVSEVREEFLNAIYVYLEENIPRRIIPIFIFYCKFNRLFIVFIQT